MVDQILNLNQQKNKVENDLDSVEKQVEDEMDELYE